VTVGHSEAESFEADTLVNKVHHIYTIARVAEVFGEDKAGSGTSPTKWTRKTGRSESTASVTRALWHSPTLELKR
jgi:hypothetical protein